MEAIGRLANLDEKGVKGYTYYSLGGPYLEDFRLLYDFYPEIGMVSIEEDPDKFKRQLFHCPCSVLQLKNERMSSYIAHYNPGSAKSVFWLDYDKLQYSCFTDFKRLLGAVAFGSMVKVTLPSDPAKLLTQDRQRTQELISAFQEKFRDLIPSEYGDPPRKKPEFAAYLQDMVHIAVQKASHAWPKHRTFVLVSSFYYSDKAPMFTLTGVVCRRDNVQRLKEAFEGWEFANLEWGPPKLINMPILSTKERLHLQPELPATNPRKTLREKLGYPIGSEEETAEALEQYATFHRRVPYFLRGVP